MAVLGLTIGAMGSKLLTNWGRRRAALLSNLIITISTIPNFFAASLWLFCITRFILGIFGAALVNTSSLLISEAVPSQY